MSGGHDSYPDQLIGGILRRVRTIAVVGASDNPARPSFLVCRYLAGRGFTVLPVNPRLAGRELAGLRSYATLAEVPGPIDMVDVFRSSADAGGVVDEALALNPLPGVIWMQLSVRDDAAAARAEAQGVTVIMNRCPKIEFGRLSGEIGWQGVNSRTISAKRPARGGAGFQRLTIRPE